MSAMRMHPAHQPLNILRFLVVGIPLIIVREQERGLEVRAKKITLRLAIFTALIAKADGNFVQIAFIEIAKLSIGGRPFTPLKCG
jgi:hypothetical protein